MPGSPIDEHNNCFGTYDDAPMPRDYNPVTGAKVIRRNDGHTAGTGIGLAAANVHNTELPQDDDEVTYDYGYYGEPQRHP